ASRPGGDARWIRGGGRGSARPPRLAGPARGSRRLCRRPARGWRRSLPRSGREWSWPRRSRRGRIPRSLERAAAGWASWFGHVEDEHGALDLLAAVVEEGGLGGQLVEISQISAFSIVDLE